MLREFIIWATSSASPYARPAGLVAEVAGIEGRYRRHKASWLPHLNSTKNFIRKHLEQADPDKPILLLGVGMCLDIPLEELSKHAPGALLSDAVLPFSTKQKVRQFPNIRLSCHDATGFVAPFWSSKDGDVVTPPETAPFPEGDFGMVISCNLLSQLPLSFANSPPTDETERRITAAIQRAHMQALEHHSCPILLITDYERLETKAGETSSIPTVPPQLLPGEPHEKWEWHIAPEGEVQPDLDVKLTVGAWLLSSR